MSPELTAYISDCNDDMMKMNLHKRGNEIHFKSYQTSLYDEYLILMLTRYTINEYVILDAIHQKQGYF